MKFNLLNNVKIDVKDKDTGKIKRSVSAHNKATRNMVRGIINFLSGKFTYASVIQDDDVDARKYIPCYIGFGTGGIINDDNPENIIFDDSWTSTVDYYATDLTQELKDSRSKIRKQENTFKSDSDEDYTNCGSADSILLYTELSPNYLNQKYDNKPVCITEFGLFPDDSSKGNMLAQVKFAYKTEEVQEGSILETVETHDMEFSIDTNGEAQIDIDEIEHCHPNILGGSLSGKVIFNTSMFIPFMDDSSGNLICTETVEDSGTSTVFATEGDIIGTVDYTAMKMTFDVTKPYIEERKEWVLSGEDNITYTGYYWNGNTIRIPKIAPRPGRKEIIKRGHFRIRYQIHYGVFPSATSTTFYVNDDGNGVMISETEVYGTGHMYPDGKIVYIPVGTVIGTCDYENWTCNILPEYSTNVGPNNMDITVEYVDMFGELVRPNVTANLARQYYRETTVGYNQGTVSFEYEVVVDETFTRYVTDAVLIHPNDVLSVTWSITVASVGEDDAFYNENVYNEFGNSPVENKYVSTAKPISNIIVLPDQENHSEETDV